MECLQEKIGATKDGKFGPLTRTAVMAFQLKNGLVADGIIGPRSRAALNNALESDNNYLPGCVSTSGYSYITGARCDGTLITPPSRSSTSKATLSLSNINKAKEKNGVEVNTVAENPNIDKFISVVAEVSRKKGRSEKEIATIADSLRKEIVTSGRDYDEEFKQMLIREASMSFNRQPPLTVLDRFFMKVLSHLGITPATAHAQAGIPFGGGVVFTFFCAYNASWMITTTPLPPSYVVLLSYYPGTQGFASYNTPYTRFLLGAYTPPGVCVIPAGFVPVTIPTEGTISPMTGSSPI